MQGPCHCAAAAPAIHASTSGRALTSPCWPGTRCPPASSAVRPSWWAPQQRAQRRAGPLVCAAEAGEGKRGGPRQAQHTRRELLLRSGLLPGSLVLAEALSSGTDDAVTVLNSVLGAYGLPGLSQANSRDFSVFDDFDVDYSFSYPRSWVKVKSQRRGVSVSNFQTADKANVVTFPAEEAGDLVQAAIQRAVVPAGDLQASDKLTLPAQNKIKSSAVDIDGLTYTYITFPSDTLTRSGYQIRRKNVAVAVVRKGTVYVLVASARGDQYNDAKAQVLKTIVESFRVRG